MELSLFVNVVEIIQTRLDIAGRISDHGPWKTPLVKIGSTTFATCKGTLLGERHIANFSLTGRGMMKSYVISHFLDSLPANIFG